MTNALVVDLPLDTQILFPNSNQGPIEATVVSAPAVMPPVSPGTANAARNTAAIQKAIDAARAAFLAGNGKPVAVELPSMRIPLGPSTSSEIFWNFGVQVPATAGCLIMRDGVELLGQGIGKTVLAPSSPSLDAVYIVDGTAQRLHDFEVDGGWTAAGAGHALLQVTSADAPLTLVENLQVERVYCHDVGSYGLGMENGIFVNCLVQAFRAARTGADGIDIKNRPLPANYSRGIFINDIYIDSPGRRLDGQAGVDVRGVCELSQIVCVGIGRAAVQMDAIRFRTYGANEGWGDRSSLTNFYVKAADPTFNVSGIALGSANVAVANGVLEDCLTSVWVSGNGTAQADNSSVSQVVAIGSTTRGFYVETSCDRVSFSQCVAVSCGIGFRNEGQGTTIQSCSAFNCTTPRSTSAGAIQSEMILEGNLWPDLLALTYLTAGRVSLEARGVTADIDIALAPKGNGRLRFGAYTAVITPVYSGTIEIKDSGGVARKLMVAT